MIALLFANMAASLVQNRNLHATETYSYEINGSEASIKIICPKLEQELIIPSNFTEEGKTYFVISIISNYRGYKIFYGDLRIPKNVTVIGAYASCDCRFNGTLELPEKLNVISDYAFINCKFI